MPQTQNVQAYDEFIIGINWRRSIISIAYPPSRNTALKQIICVKRCQSFDIIAHFKLLKTYITLLLSTNKCLQNKIEMPYIHFLEAFIGIFKISAYGELCRYRDNSPPPVVAVFDVIDIKGIGEICDNVFICIVAGFYL